KGRNHRPAGRIPLVAHWLAAVAGAPSTTVVAGGSGVPASRAAVPGASTVLVAVLVAGPAVADGVVRGPNRIACPRVVMGIVRSAVDSVPVGVVVCRGSVSIATAEGWRCAAGGPSAANVVPALPPPATAGGESSCHG